MIVRPEGLLKDLSGLWTQLGKEETEGSERSAGVLRAVTMTFLLGVDEGDDAANEALATLMHDRPSRAIVLKLMKDDNAELTGRAFAQCWMPFGRRQQICCEQIELSAGAKHFEDTLSLLRGLVAPDLPVVFWCRSTKLFAHSSFAELAAVSDKVILDSRSHPDPLKTVQFVNSQLKAGKLYGDLTWTRLTRWRETVATVFDRLDCKTFFDCLSRTEIQYTHTPTPMAVGYLSAWFRSIFGDRVPVEKVLTARDVPWQISEIRFVTPKDEVTIDRMDKGLVESHIRDFRTRSVFEVLDETRLVAEELAILGRDPIFAKAVELASLS
ncbi:glucose-6-phosphate dehydrogenase assembly protein OpcA [Bryobacter aggregatus]|uniref:glucose-6-phosphate dehydrogenase assembly protein OpcA n=1 Tax=Bryobacter aggregatus TaxID=360054 RepID=UPI00138E4D39|nr:glucose-6-phosphate dehydrogenase assembly protein OpcA [Bryobacter aggregatus]